jgi:hypothetical protein
MASNESSAATNQGEQLEIDPQPKISQCRSCRRSIIWARTERGKKMPLDARPVELAVTGDGPARALFVLRDRESRDGPLAIAAWGLHGLEDHYRSHFSSCPQADEHRRPKATESEDNDQPPQDPGWRYAGRRYRDSAR